MNDFVLFVVPVYLEENKRKKHYTSVFINTHKRKQEWQREREQIELHRQSQIKHVLKEKPI